VPARFRDEAVVAQRAVETLVFVDKRNSVTIGGGKR